MDKCTFQNEDESMSELVKTGGAGTGTGESEEDYLSTSSDDENGFSHKEATERFQNGLAELILGDPLLSDLPTQITIEEVESQIALVHGGAICVNIRRADDTVLMVVIKQNATVLDLKKAIKSRMQLKLSRENLQEHISWRYIWKTYWLYFNGQKLSEDGKLLKEYGINNRDEITFIKKLQEK